MSDAVRHLSADLAGELLQHYGAGRATLAIDGPDDVETAGMAAEVAAQLTARGVVVERVALADAEAMRTFREETLPAFRRQPGSAVLVVDGHGLHEPGVVDIWNLSVWLDAGDEADARARAADAIVDVSDPAHPVRRFADWCAVPRRR